MGERHFRLLIGVWLLAALIAVWPLAIYALMAVLLVEGITNWRVPALVSRLRYGRQMQEIDAEAGKCVLSFEAERALRLIIVAFLSVALFVAPQFLWWLPWFIAFALIGAGLSGICPMVSALRWAGLR